MVSQARGFDGVQDEAEAFWWTVRSRVVMSLSTNMRLGLREHGDWVFALRQWARWPKFLHDLTQSLQDVTG